MSELEQALAEALEARQAAIDRRDAERYRSLMDDVREQARRDGMVVSHIDVLARQAAIGAAVERLPDYWYVEHFDDLWHVMHNMSEPPCLAHNATLDSALIAALDADGGEVPSPDWLESRRVHPGDDQ